MTFQPGANLYTQGFGSRPENVEVPHYENRAPTSADTNYPIGKKWINSTANETYTLTSLLISQNSASATWVGSGGGGTSVTQLGTNSGTATPVAGDINVIGDGTTIQTSGVLNNVTVGLVPNIETNFSLNTDPGNANSITMGNATGTGLFQFDAPISGFNVFTAANPINIGATSNGSAITVGKYGPTNVGGYLTLGAGTGGLQLYGNQQVNTRVLSANGTASETDSLILFDVTSQSLLFLLPATIIVGQLYYVTHILGDVTVNGIVIGGNGHNIFYPNGNTGATFTFTENYASYTIVGATNGWFLR